MKRYNLIFLIALRYFTAKKNEKFVSIISTFSLIGVAIGVAALIVVMSVMNGFHKELTKNIIGLGGDISIKSAANSINDYPDIIKKLEQENYVKIAIPSVFSQALVISKSTSSGALVRGFRAEDLKFKGEIAKNVLAGSFDDFSGNNIVAVGSGLASTLHLRIGSKIKLIAPQTISTAFGSMPRAKEFEVVAVFSSGMSDYDEATIIMPLITAQHFFSFIDKINLIEISTIDSEKASTFANKISSLLENKFRVTSWYTSNLQFLNALAVERVAMFTILSLIIVVAALNIVSSLFMIVKDKTKDIAILRTIGASMNQIMLIFILNGLFVGILGTLSGVMLGVGFAYNIQSIKACLEKFSGIKLFDSAIYFLYTLPSDVQQTDVLTIASLSMLLCLCATIYPAYKASKLNPVDILRYE